MIELIFAEYENGRTFAIQVLSENEADLSCDTIRFEVDGKPLLDMTPGEFADLAHLFPAALAKYFKMLLTTDDAFLIALEASRLKDSDA